MFFSSCCNLNLKVVRVFPPTLHYFGVWRWGEDSNQTKMKKTSLAPEFTLQIIALSLDQSHRHEKAGLMLSQYSMRHVIITSHHLHTKTMATIAKIITIKQPWRHQFLISEMELLIVFVILTWNYSTRRNSGHGPCWHKFVFCFLQLMMTYLAVKKWKLREISTCTMAPFSVHFLLVSSTLWEIAAAASSKCIVAAASICQSRIVNSCCGQLRQKKRTLISLFIHS